MDESDKIKVKMEAIWKARDNEAGAVKDRALLVWGFLIFCYTGYAYLAAKAMFACSSNSQNSALCASHLAAINWVMMCLSLVALRLSLHWVRMLKGAKAWAENFDYLAENFQHCFLPLRGQESKRPFYSRNTQGHSPCPVLDGIKRDKNCSECQGDASYACIFSVTNPASGYYPELDECDLTVRGGPYSPAKTTIAIARMSLVIALSLSIAHLAVACCGIECSRSFVLQHRHWAKWAAIAIFFVMALMPLWGTVSKLHPVKSLLDILLMRDTQSMGLGDIKKIRGIYAP